jgi:hypothetical protein
MPRHALSPADAIEHLRTIVGDLSSAYLARYEHMPASERYDAFRADLAEAWPALVILEPSLRRVDLPTLIRQIDDFPPIIRFDVIVKLLVSRMLLGFGERHRDDHLLGARPLHATATTPGVD